MIKIVPSVLATSITDFNSQISKLKDFETLDIDIIEPPFAPESTVSLTEVLKNVASLNQKLCFHLMIQNPEKAVNHIIQSGTEFECIFIHQESDLAFIKNLTQKIQKKLGITIKKESRVREINFYKDFTSIQLMTGKFGRQGVDFDKESLAKSLELRELGFLGKIGIDGGVNLKSAKIIKDYPIDRVSVGSFLHKSSNPLLDKMKLDLALNLKSVE